MRFDLEAEFWRAIRFAKASGIAFPLSNRVQWGCARVEFYGNKLYEPRPDGAVMAFIAPVVEGGDLIDLCAIDSFNNRCAQRAGYGKGLGLDVIEKARQRCCELRLVETPMAWLRWPVDSVYLFDLASVAVTLDGVPVIACETLELSDRVAALLPPSQRQRAMVA
jgi:hypothetical protein